MKVNSAKQYILTKSNDGCVIIVQSNTKSEKGDMFISSQVLQRNVKLGTFTKHKNLKHNKHPVYVLTEDLNKL